MAIVREEPTPKSAVELVDYGMMKDAYCSYIDCSNDKIYDYAKPGEKCFECGKPLSWAGRNPYYDRRWDPEWIAEQERRGKPRDPEETSERHRWKRPVLEGKFRKPHGKWKL